jgi:hypothetical protein
MKTLISIVCFLICCQPAEICAQNAPISIAGTVVSLATEVTVPVYAMNFNNISSCNLKLTYDPSIATATGVTIGPEMAGIISVNITVPGEVSLGWFTSGGITLPDSSVIFNLQFSKSGNGISSVHWMDNDNSCEYNDGNSQPLTDSPTSDYYQDGMLVFQSPDAPITVAPNIAAIPGSELNFPVYVSNFQMIGSFSLNLQFDASVLSYLSFVNSSEFPGMSVNEDQPGNLLISGMVQSGDTAISLEDNAILLTLNLNYLDGYTELNWIDTGTSCQYRGSTPVYPVLNDTPQDIYYLNGSVSANSLPAEAGSITGPSVVCIDNSAVTYSVEIIDYATDYVWNVPEGAVIVSGQNSPTILVDLGINPLIGVISVYGTNAYGNGSASSLEISVIDQPGTPGIITGLQEVCRGQSQVMYSIEPLANTDSYSWLVPEGAFITSGNSTYSIMVHYGINAASGLVSVTGTNICGIGASSQPLTVTVKEQPEIEIQPESPPAVIAGADTALFTLQAAGTGLSYKWQEFINSWEDLIENDLYMGVFSDTLFVLNPSVVMDGYRYRCIVSGECDPDAVTDGNATLAVSSPVKSEFGSKETLVSAYPNPFSEELNLNLTVQNKGETVIELLSLTGQIIISKKVNFSLPGIHSVCFDTSGIRSGAYLLRIKHNSEFNLIYTTLCVVCCN